MTDQVHFAEDFEHLYPKARARESDALSRLLQLVREDLERYVTRKLNTRGRLIGDEDDVLQDVCNVVKNKISGYDENLSAEDFRIFITRIAKSRCIDYLRRVRTEESLIEDALSPTRDQTGTVTRRDDLLKLRVLLESLPTEWSILIQAHYGDGRSTRSIAEDLDLAPATVRARLDEARRMLRTQWNDSRGQRP